MFPTLSDLFNFLFNSQINLPFRTYGFMLALGFLAGGLIMRSELKRKETEGLLEARIRNIPVSGPLAVFKIIAGWIVFMVTCWKLGGIIFEYSLFVSDPAKYLFSLQGSTVVLVAAVMLRLVLQLVRRYAFQRDPGGTREAVIHPFQHTWGIMVVAIISAIAGSKLFDLFDHFDSFQRNPLSALFAFNGFSFNGGLILTVAALIMYMRVIRLDWKQVIDATAPAIIAGYAIGRLGCHLSGDGCWGIANTMPQPGWLSWLPGWLWACDYPHNIVNAGLLIPGCSGQYCRVLEQPVFPTSIYEAAASFLIFGLLWIVRKKIRPPVVLFGLFLVLYGSERLLIEPIRVNTRHAILGMQLSQAEIISVLLIFSGLTVMVFYRWSHKRFLQTGV